MAKAAKVEKRNANLPYPKKFTASSLVAFVADKNGVSKKEMKQIMEDVFDVIRAGMFKGARVPLGTFGKIFVKVKPATSERKGRNPLTGAEITIKAKPATKVPKISFNKAFKETVKAS